MIIYLSISQTLQTKFILKNFPPSDVNILTAFPYRQAVKKFHVYHFRHFLADSGAFTAMNAGTPIDGDYIQRYIDWINQNNVKYYMEMDLDEIIGYEKTLKIRKTIERQTGLQSIPVWHFERGEDGWKRMCDENMISLRSLFPA